MIKQLMRKFKAKKDYFVVRFATQHIIALARHLGVSAEDLVRRVFEDKENEEYMKAMSLAQTTMMLEHANTREDMAEALQLRELIGKIDRGELSEGELRKLLEQIKGRIED